MFDEVFDIPINNDVVITTLPQIKKFEVYDGMMYAEQPESDSEDEQNEQEGGGADSNVRYVLEGFKLDRCELSHAALTYVGRTCHALKMLHFNAVYLDANDDKEMEIFLPAADFDLLHVYDIHQSVGGFAFRVYMQSHHPGQHSTILSLMQLKRWWHLAQRKKLDVTEVPLQRWYHEYEDPRSKKFKRYLQRIPEDSVYRLRDDNEDLTDIPHEEPQVNNKKYWKQDIFLAVYRYSVVASRKLFLIGRP